MNLLKRKEELKRLTPGSPEWLDKKESIQAFEELYKELDMMDAIFDS
jgi:hypothetical protein